jgi:hypothetical protein
MKDLTGALQNSFGRLLLKYFVVSATPIRCALLSVAMSMQNYRWAVM